MPVVAPLLSVSISSQMMAQGLKGRDGIKLSGAVASSLASYLTLPNLVSCNLTGTAGPVGNINSISVFGLIPKTMSSLMVSKAFSKNLKGRDISKLCDAISNGVCQVLNGMMLSGTAAGIAVGSGLGNFTAVNAGSLSGLMLANMQSKQINGRDISKLCDSISYGIVQHLKTSVRFSLLVTGAIAPVPPAGPVAVTGIPSIFTKII